MACPMKKQIIIHVGSVKTGSSYLQRLFSANRSALQEAGICYSAFREDGERFANGNMLRDRTLVSEVRALVESDENNTLLFSEEGLFVGFLSAIPTYFWEHDVKIVAYVRDPVEVIAAWAAELSKPYNAHRGEVRDIEENVSLLCERYGEEMQGFLGCVDYAREGSVIVRPYSRSAFHAGSLEADFFQAVGRVDILDHLPNGIDEAVNPTYNRKYCDVSSTLYSILKKADRLYEYDERLVATINANCQSGDPRSVAETIGSRAPEIMEKLSWVDAEMMKRLPREPSAYASQKFKTGSTGEPAIPVSKPEVEYQLLRLSVARNVSEQNGIDPYSPDLSDEDIALAVERSLQSLEQQHDELLRQRSELLKMRRYARGALL